MVNDQHSFFPRNSILSVVSPHVKSSGKKTFRFSAGKIWNALPVSLRSADLHRMQAAQAFQRHIDRPDPVWLFFSQSCVSLLYFADGPEFNLSRLLTCICLDLRCWSGTFAPIIFSLPRLVASWISHVNREFIPKKSHQLVAHVFCQPIFMSRVTSQIP